jgi:hypothetical protein
MQMNYLFALIGAGFVIYGLYRSYTTYTFYRKITASQNWQVTSGKVTGATTRYTSGSRGSRHYRAQFSYSFTVLGSDFTGDFKIDSFLGLKGTAEKDVEQHPTGTAVTLHYNPENPGECVSEYDKVSVSDLLAILGSLIIGALSIYQSFRLIIAP